MNIQGFLSECHKNNRIHKLPVKVYKHKNKFLKNHYYPRFGESHTKFRLEKLDLMHERWEEMHVCIHILSKQCFKNHDDDFEPSYKPAT